MRPPLACFLPRFLLLIFISLTGIQSGEAQIFKKRKKQKPRAAAVQTHEAMSPGHAQVPIRKSLKSKSSIDYHSLERKIDSLMGIRQFKTAAALNTELLRVSLADARKGYWVKAILNECTLIAQTEDYPAQGRLQWRKLQEAFDSSDESGSMLMAMELAAFLRSRYNTKLSFTETADEDSAADPARWSKAKLQSETRRYITYAVRLSLQYTLADPQYVQPLIIYTKDYDWFTDLDAVFARRAIEILRGLETETGIAYRSPDVRVAESVADSFIRSDFSKAHDPRNEYLILSLYQQLLKNYHVFFDLERLDYVYSLKGQKAGYAQVLEDLYRNRRTDPFVNFVAIRLAALFEEEGEPAKAVALMEDALQNHPGFRGNAELRYRLKIIQSPVLSLSAEKHNRPGRPMLAKISYKNTHRFYLSIYRISDDTGYIRLKSLGYGYHPDQKQQIVKRLSGMEQLLVSKLFPLPAYTDYRMHTAELALDSLPAGTYLFLSSSSADLSDTSLLLNAGIVHVAPYLVLKEENKIRLHAASDGKPLAGVPYRLLLERNGKYHQLRSGYSNADGLIETPPSKEYVREWLIDIGRATLFYETVSYAGYTSENKEQTEVKILSDRSIYRPGQTVYFKCIAYGSESKKTLAGISLKVQLMNSNGEEKGSLSLTTNRYGSVAGSFVLPKSGFSTGMFSLSLGKLGQHSFRVEEYKRPRFKAEIMSPDSAFALGDSVVLKGRVMALAGFAIQQAKVRYTVTRRERMIWFRSYPYPGYGASQTIVAAETHSDPEGGFKICFQAVPDPKIPETSQPYFIYSVQAVVTDINGETRTCSYDLTMAYTDRELMLSGPENCLSRQKAELRFAVQNLQGKKLPFTGKIVLKRRVDAGVLKRERFWQPTDTTLLSEEDYRKYFSHYTDRNERETLLPVSEKYFTADNSGSWTIPASDLTLTGEYVAVMQTTDPRGDTLETSFRFHVNASEPGPYPGSEALQMYLLNGRVFEPGQTARLMIGSAAGQVVLTLTASSERGMFMSKTLVLNRNSVLVDIPVSAADRGNIIVQLRTVSDYRYYAAAETITVPYSNKQLQVALSSFRDQTEPGAKEKWTITLRGPASEKAAMEMAAVMYDQSLDELYPGNHWQFSLYNEYMDYTETEHGLGEEILYPWLSPAVPASSYKTYTFPSYESYYRHYNGFRHFESNIKYDRLSESTEYEWSTDGDQNNAVLARSKLSASEYSSSAVQKPEPEKSGPIQTVPRKDFRETAFFFPQLYAKANGEIQIEFTMPEALTRWRMQMLAHSTSMQLGYAEHLISTSKKLMLQPNLPRFLRQGDHIRIASKIVNTGTEVLQVNAGIEITEEASGKKLDWLSSPGSKTIVLAAGAVATCEFTVRIPEYTGVVSIRITAGSAQFSDGEQHTLAVLSRRSLITRTLPLTIRNAGTQNFEFTELKTNNSPSLRHEKLSVEMSANPAWYAIQSLPYLMEFPNECAEQIFTRLYANSVASALANRHASVRQVYQSWVRAGKLSGASFQSKLMQNQDLKTTLIEETPWLMEARNETERMQRMGKLFDAEKMQQEQQSAFDRLKDMQTPEGAWSWFKGMPANSYITQTILIGFGKMRAMGVDISAYMPSINRAINWLDMHYERQHQQAVQSVKRHAFGPDYIQYLYCKHFFPQSGFAASHAMLIDIIGEAEKHWASYSLLSQTQLALALRLLKPASSVPGLILRGLEESAKQSDEAGMYWPQNQGGYYWYQAAIETQAAVIELYTESGQDPSKIREQQIWLLRHKQTQNWKGSRSTADACYALLRNSELLSAQREISIRLGDKPLIPEKTEEGSAYFRKDIPAGQISQKSADVQVQTGGSGFSYGAVYWQYFEDNEKVQNAGSGLRIEKKLYRLYHTPEGSRRTEIKTGDTLSRGDLIEVVLRLESDRNLEYIHVKDQRAAGTEPADVLSTYLWKNGLSYYMSTKDASSSFFIEQMAAGSYQLSYILKAEQSGNFDCGPATAQCMYAPEYTANSKSPIMLVR